MVGFLKRYRLDDRRTEMFFQELHIFVGGGDIMGGMDDQGRRAEGGQLRTDDLLKFDNLPDAPNRHLVVASEVSLSPGIADRRAHPLLLIPVEVMKRGLGQDR